MVRQDLTFSALTPSRAVFAALCVAAAACSVGLAASQALGADAVLIVKSLILAPVIEELFFRGVVQSRLRAQRGFPGRPWVAILATAILFAVAHLPAASLSHAVAVIAPACVIGWIYERTRSIGFCIAVHSASNAMWLAYWST